MEFSDEIAEATNSACGGGSQVKKLLQKLLVESDAAVRQHLEYDLKQNQDNFEDYGAELSLIVCGQNEAVELRQLSSVLLKQYIESRWDSAPERVKLHVRALLCQQLNDPNPKIRNGVAYALSAIAKHDWPAKWPDLFLFISQTIGSPDASLAHGTMRLLTELANMVEETQLEHITPVLFPQLLKIIEDQQLVSVRTRSRAVMVFGTVASCMEGNTEEKHERRKRLLLPWLQKFGKVLTAQLIVSENISVDDIDLKTSIMNCFNALIGFFPRQIARWFGQSIASSTFLLLFRCSEHHLCSVVDESSTEDEMTNSDGDMHVPNLDQLGFQVCEFIQKMSCNSCFLEYLEPYYGEMFYSVLCFLQLSDEKVEEWCESVDQFVEEEDEENCLECARMTAKELILAVCENCASSSTGFCVAVKRHLAESKRRKSQNRDTLWWKQVEATITGLGCVVDFLLSETDRMKAELNLTELLTEHVFPSLEPSNFLLLRGQALWFLSRIVACLPLDWQKRLCEVCVLFLEKEQPALIKVCAIRALYNICEEIRFSKHIFLLDEHLERIICGFVNLAIVSGETIVSLTLNTLQSCSAACPIMVSKYERKIGPLMMACCLKYSGDPVIPSQCCDIVRCLARLESCREKLEERVLPTSLSVLQSPHPSRLPMQLPSVCLDLIQALAKGRGAPLSERMLNQAFPAVIDTVLKSEDVDTLASGRETIRAFISLSPTQLVQWHDGKGNTGLSLIIEVICHFVKPETPDLSASMVCRLVYAVLKVAGRDVRPYLDGIVKAVISKMANSEVNRVRQGLVVIFCYLFNYEVDSLVQFLYGLPSPNSSLGANALEFVVVDWCDYHRRFTAMHDRKVSTLALCQLLQYCGKRINDGFLQNLLVGVEREPVLIHIFRLIIEELRIICHEKNSGKCECFTSNEEMDVGVITEQKCDDQKPVGLGETLDSTEHDALADICRDLEEVSSSDDGENLDPEGGTDPLRELDLNHYLVSFLKEFQKNEHYQSFVERIPVSDAVLLRELGLA